MPYLFPEDEDLTPQTQPLSATTMPTQGDGDYLFGDESEQPPLQPRPRLQVPQPQAPQPQESPQLFPVGQDHVAREVLGLKPKPYQRSEILPESHYGILGDVGSAVASSFLRAGEMTLQTLRAYDAPGGIDAVRDLTTAGIEKIREWEDEYPRIFKPSEENQNSYFRRSLYSALVNFTPSAYSGLLGGLAGAAVGSVGGPVGAAIGFVLGFGGGAGLLFGSAEYDSFMEEADANGIPREQVFGEALTSAFVEGGGEMVADIVSLLAFGPTGGLSISAKGALKEMMRMPVKTLVKDFLKTVPVEVGTEMIQGAAQIHLRNKAGMDAGSPWEAALDAIGPAVIMTALFGAAGGAKQTLHLRQMRKALADGNADPAKRQAAADFVEKEIKDKDFKELWRFNAKQFIDNNYGIPIDRPMAEYLALGQKSEFSPKLAEDLAAGKDIKLLPEGQGFVLKGEPYDPDSKDEYDKYSPEMAEALLKEKNTKLLPDGVGFTVGAGDDQYTVYSTELAKKLRKEKERKLLEEPKRGLEEGGAVTEPIEPVEAAARGVEAAIETGTEEDIAQAQRRLARRQAREGLANRLPALVRQTLKKNPQSSIGEIYRQVKKQDPTASRQDVAAIIKGEKLEGVPTLKDLNREKKRLDKAEFQDRFNPTKVAGRLYNQYVSEGMDKKEALARSKEDVKEYEEVWKKATAEKPLQAAERPKKKKTDLAAKKEKPAAKQAKKAAPVEVKEEAKPTKKKASAAEAVAAMEKPKKKLVAKPKKKNYNSMTIPQLRAAIDAHGEKYSKALTGISMQKGDLIKTLKSLDETGKPDLIVAKRVENIEAGLLPGGQEKPGKLRKKGTKEAKASEKKREEIKEEKKKKKKGFAIGDKVKTDDGNGEIIENPQPKQWVVKMTSGIMKGDNLIFAQSELEQRASKKGMEKLEKVTYEALAAIEEATEGNEFTETVAGEKVTVHGKGIAGELREKKFIKWIGKKIKNMGDLGIIAQVARDPRMEHQHVVLTRRGKIIYHTTHTSKLPHKVTTQNTPGMGFMAWADEMANLAKKMKADAMYVLHNHPTGDPSPSEADIMVDLLLTREIPQFAGTVVINHKTFQTIRSRKEGNNWKWDIQEYNLPLPTKATDPMKAYIGRAKPLLHKQAGIEGRSSAYAMAQMANALVNDPHQVTFFLLSSDFTIRGIVSMPYRLFRPENRDEMRIWLGNTMREQGAVRSTAYVPSIKLLEKEAGVDLGPEVGGFVKRGWLKDVGISAEGYLTKLVEEGYLNDVLIADRASGVEWLLKDYDVGEKRPWSSRKDSFISSDGDMYLGKNIASNKDRIFLESKDELLKRATTSYATGSKKAGPDQNVLVQRDKDKRGTVLLVQLKSREKSVDEEGKTYDKIYDTREGYNRPDDFWEIPMWMGEASNTFEDADMYVIRNDEKAIKELSGLGYPTIMFSVLDINKARIHNIAKRYGGKVIVGGYVDKAYFDDLDNVTFLDSVKSAAKELGVTYKAGVDYTMFKDTETIPRLCLSKGCKHKCAFCVVPKTILVSPKDFVRKQVEAFKNLKFKLIYLDDKTFGQAPNYKDLTNVYKEIKKFNPEFEGFIIQTTAPALLKMDDAFIKESGIKYVELGVESYNDDILQKVNKPHRTKQLDKAVVKLRKNGINFIPNIIVGMAGKGWSETRDSYENTMQFLERNRDIISHVNVYNLALYEGTELHEQLDDKLDTDINEQATTKSFHEDKEIHDEFYKRVLGFMNEVLDQDPQTPVTLVRYTKTPSITTMDPGEQSHRTDIPGIEKKRLVGDPDAPNRLHYYVEGTKEEPHVALLPYKYRTEVPRGRLYNIITDPLGLKTAAKRPGMVVADPNLAEQMMAEAGYVGYLGTSKDTVAAAIFEPLKVERVVKTTEMRPRSSKSVANQARAQRVEGYRAIIRRAIPTASKIIPDPKVHDIFTVILPNGAKIEVKFNAMPEGVNVMALAKELYGHRAIADDEVPLGLWVPSDNVTITGEGIIYIAGIGDLQADFDHEVYHAAKSIVLTKAENEQLKKDYPRGEEQEAEAYEKWRKTNASHKIFDKIRSFFRRIQEAFGLGKGKSYQIFRTINDGKVWARSFKGSDAKGGRLRAAMYSLLDEVPKFKGAIGQANEEDIMHDFRQWENLGAVLYIEGLQGREWTAEMTAQLKEHYRLDKLPQGVVKHIRKASQHVFKTRAAETLTGKLPTLEALMEMERRGAQEGGMVWYDDRDGLSMLVPNEAGELEARSAKGELEEFFGDDAEFMAGLIAHLSSGMQVPPNVQKAIEVYVAHKLGLSFTGTYQVTKKQIDEFLETRQTSGPKRLPFFNAIMGDADAVVIDRWMARVLDFRTWNNKKEVWQTSTGATETQRNLLIEWVKRGAKRMGISNRAYQALIWSGKKALDEEAAGKPTGSLEPLYKVINQKLTVNGIPADQIPAGKEGEYFILPGVDRWAIPLAKFMPLQSDPLIKVKESKRPSDLVVPKAVDKPLTAKEEADLAAQQGKLFAKMGRPETAVEDSLEEIFGGTHKGILRRMIDGWKRVTLRTQLLDEFHPILKHLGERTYRLHRMLNGVHASVEALMRHGKLRLNDDGVIEADGVRRGFAVWVKKNGQDAVNVLRWAAAKRAEHLERTNPEFLKNEEFLDRAKRERILAEIGEGPTRGGTWEELHAEFREFHDSVLDIAYKAGIIDEKLRDDWGDLVYVPFYRVFEDPDTREEYLANPRKAKDIAAKAKPIKGSKRKIGEPLENVVANWGYMIQESMRNQARAEAYVNAKLLSEVSDLMQDIDYQEIKHTIIQDGVITYTTKKGDQNVLSFLDNGKRKYFKVNDAELYHALTTVNAKHFGKLFNMFFGGPKRMLTYGATFGPAFRIANAVRDTLHTWMITPGMSFTPFLDTFRGFMSAMREDEHYVAALAAGGLHGGSYVHAEDPASMHKFTKRLLSKEKGSVILDSGMKILDFWDKLGAASENAARVQLHKNLKAQGETTLEAGYQARDLLDFALKGQAKVVLALIRTIPFLGARTQGNYRLVRAAMDPKTRYSMALKGMILASASLALWAAFKDDDRYKELEDYDKWTYYHWWIGDQHFRMPKPFEVGAIFSSLFESVANTMTDEEEIEFLGRFIKYTLTETFAVGVPQTVKPLAELWANKSFFTGRPIEGKAMQMLKPGQRAEPWTSESLRLLGKGLNISPKKMESLVRGYFATLGMFFLSGADQAARWVGDFPERPTRRSDDYPLVGRFWRQGPARNTKNATRLYEVMTESDMLVQTVKHYMMTGNMEAAKRLANSDLAAFTSNKMLNRIRKKLTAVRNAMKDVERSDATSAEKRQKIDDLTILRNNLMKEVYQVYQEQKLRQKKK